jgi:hypothetical protein
MVGHQQRFNSRKMIDDKNDGSAGDVLCAMKIYFSPGETCKHLDGQTCGSVGKRIHGLITGRIRILRSKPS